MSLQSLIANLFQPKFYLFLESRKVLLEDRTKLNVEQLLELRTALRNNTFNKDNYPAITEVLSLTPYIQSIPEFGSQTSSLQILKVMTIDFEDWQTITPN
jgi:hypothetical protein